MAPNLATPQAVQNENEPIPQDHHLSLSVFLRRCLRRVVVDVYAIRTHVLPYANRSLPEIEEKWKKQAQKDAGESNKRLLELPSKLQESEEQALELLPSKNVDLVERFEAQSIEKQHINDSTALDEIKELDLQFESVAESARIELNKLKEELLAEALVFVENMKNQLSDCKKSEAEAQGLVGETLMQLETAKKMVEALRSDGCKATVVYNAVKSELEQSRARVIFLEELVIKLKADNVEIEGKKDGEFIEKLQVEQLRSAKVKHNEECVEEIRNAFKMVEEIKSASGWREAELEAELRKSSYEIEELRASLMDKETELQGICEEYDTLLMQLGSRVPECELEKEVKSLRAGMESMKARLESVMEENEALKLDSNKVVCDLEEARGGEREAVMKVGWMRGEMDKSERKAARVAEQLEAAQGAIGEMELELRKLKVQSDQWRKAAEVAAAMLTVGSNGAFVGRTGSMEKKCSSFYGDDFDEDLMRKKNVKMLRRFGVLWKK